MIIDLPNADFEHHLWSTRKYPRCVHRKYSWFTWTGFPSDQRTRILTRNHQLRWWSKSSPICSDFDLFWFWSDSAFDTWKLRVVLGGTNLSSQIHRFGWDPSIDEGMHGNTDSWCIQFNSLPANANVEHLFYILYSLYSTRFTQGRSSVMMVK